MRGRSESEILIFGWVLVCAESGVNMLTDDFGADINIVLTHRNRRNGKYPLCSCLPFVLVPNTVMSSA